MVSWEIPKLKRYGVAKSSAVLNLVFGIADRRSSTHSAVVQTRIESRLWEERVQCA